MKLLAPLAAALLFAAPALAQTSADVAQPENWDADLRMAEVTDTNADPQVLEFNLTASVTEMEILPGATTPAWTYNGTLPGPIIRANVGDRVIVHFTNNLPEPTTIHWHGLRVPNAMDGAPGATQPAIEPGQRFTYDFTVQDAGTFWYHPHFNSPTQVGHGLYGAFIVTDPAEPQFADELILILSDISLNPDGSFRPADQGGEFGDLFGREGDTVLVNGRIQPELLVRQGKQQRWRVIDAAITRYFPIALRDHRWIRVGGDGGLLAQAEADLPRLALTPGERADLIFTPANPPGETQTMYALPVDRGFGTAVGRTRVPLLDIVTVDEPGVTPLPAPTGALRTIAPIDIAGAAEKTVELTIQLDDATAPMMGINDIPHEHLLQTQTGATEVWTIVNDTDFDHPFHLHGFFFQVMDENGQMRGTPEWKDTVNVPDHTSLRIAVDFDDRPGMWMFHCHILDHAEQGMMGLLYVAADAGDTPPQITAEDMGEMHHNH